MYMFKCALLETSHDIACCADNLRHLRKKETRKFINRVGKNPVVMGILHFLDCQ